MQSHIMFKHFINQEGHLEDLEGKIEKIKEGIEISKQRQFPIDFSLKLSLDMQNFPKDLKERTIQAIRSLPKEMFYIYNPKEIGEGNATKQILFNPVFLDSPGITYLAGLDQTVVNSTNSLERVIELTRKNEKDKGLLAIGLRDVPVILGIHKRNSNLRIIHELFHSLTMGSEKIKADEIKPQGSVTPAYAEIGESTTHFYGFNNTHENYPELVKSIFKASQVANMKGNAADYYLVIKASELGNITTGYVISTKNDFYGTIDEQKEYESVKKMIYSQTRELIKTDISKRLSLTLKNPINTKKISLFYPTKDVELVRDLMKSAFE